MRRKKLSSVILGYEQQKYCVLGTGGYTVWKIHRFEVLALMASPNFSSRRVA